MSVRTPSEGKEWLGAKEAAQMLGITNRTLYRLLDEGKLPAYQLGRVFRLRRSDLEAFLQSVRIKPGTLGHLYPEGKPLEDR